MEIGIIEIIALILFNIDIIRTKKIEGWFVYLGYISFIPGLIGTLLLSFSIVNSFDDLKIKIIRLTFWLLMLILGVNILRRSDQN
ncbi:hypothetical protein [Dethiothermospora halolimnae]|uniref:hypothetical protein n=1 Tax=Dethiothermospora halolimnae TaxID=3114390 RepID=UPI003CCBE4B3